MTSLSPVWTDLLDDELTVDLISKVLSPVQDDLWVATACLDRVLDVVEVQRELLKLGISRTDNAVQRCTDVFLETSQGQGKDVQGLEGKAGSSDGRDSASAMQGIGACQRKDLSRYFVSHSEDAILCGVRTVLVDRLHRLETYVRLGERMEEFEQALDEEDSEEGWEDDPWAEDGEGAESKELNASSKPRPRIPPPLPLSVFITQHTRLMCLSLTSQMQFDALRFLLERSPEMIPHRFGILQNIPFFADPTNYRDILPAIDPSTGNEQGQLGTRDGDEDWCMQPEVRDALHEALETMDQQWIAQLSDMDGSPDDYSLQKGLLSGKELLAWYTRRVNDTLSSCGMVDIALSLVQHGVSHGLTDLDEVGEDLTLISRLVYDALRSDSEGISAMTLDQWRSIPPAGILQHYLSMSSPETIVSDIRRLAMPYLFVLESRCERAGKSDPSLVKRHLFNYILEAPLNILVPIFEASKPTLVASQRIISDDEDLARLALSCLYGSDSINSWSDMSRIFECLPAWNLSSTDIEDEDEADTTVASLSAFLAPSTFRPRCSPADLLSFFKPLPAKSLSRALDILDVHLESGEILARWDTPMVLRWLLQSSHNESQQRALATKLVRQAGETLDTEDEWLSLLEDMLKLAQVDDVTTNSAFGALSKDGIRRILFSGLLSSGNFPIAKTLVRPRRGERLLDETVVEELCLESSRAFYDNATSGNYNFGDMKQAYDCLSVAQPSPTIQKERDFIEATSRISSFNIMSRPGVPLLPLEIRLTKDKLTLISRVLSGNESSYKHTEVILELMRKLGFKDDVLAEVKTLAMITDTALQAEDFERAFGTSDRMIQAVLQLKKTALDSFESPELAEAIEVCWVSCYQLGRQTEAEDTNRKMALLGRALELCPPDRMVDILTAWRKLESEDIEQRQERLHDKSSTDDRSARRKDRKPRGRTATLASRLHGLQMPSPSLPSAPDAAAMASHALNRVAASLPFSLSGRDRSSSREGRQRRAGSPDAQSHARHALQRGIGWLIGADESEL